MMKKRIAILALSAVLAMQALGLTASAQEDPESQDKPDASPASVQDLGFKFAEGKSRLEISFDRDVTFEKKVSEADRQVILDISNAKIAKKWARRIDTSQHKSNISLVSPYQSGDLVRVVLQLKENGGVEISQEGSKIVATIDNKVGENKAGDSPPSDKPAETKDAQSTPVVPDAGKNEPPPVAEAPAPSPTPAATATQESESADPLDTFFNSQKQKAYVGKRITLQVRDAELADVFRIISEASEFNIVLSETVKGKIMLNLSDVPWDQALDLILHSYRLAAERQGNVLRVTTLDALTKEKEAEAAARRATEQAEPMVVKIFPISYAKLTDIRNVIVDFLSREGGMSVGPAIMSATGGAGAAQPTSSGAIRGSIQIDQRTNSLIVRDTPATMEKVRRILKELDTPTPQVLVEGKFVEVDENHTKTVEGRIFASSREFDSTSNSLIFRPANNNYGALFGGTAFGAAGTLPTGFAITPVSGMSLGFTPKTGLIPGVSEIGAFLSVLESESQARIVASPRVVTQNKETATINQGQIIQLPTQPGANAAGSFQTVNVVLQLSVTPQVTNDGSISMKLTFNQDSLGSQSVTSGQPLTVNTKKVETNVVVDSGATLVIGGIYGSQVNTSAAGIPILRELPIIGFLFGSKGRIEQKTELFIFLTPRIINDRETGTKG